MTYNVSNLLYLITIVTFVLALRFLSNPAHARRGNQIGAIGMLVAIGVTFAQRQVDRWWLIVVGMAVGGTFGAVAARKVRMTAMPQMVALFNGVGGGAVALISWAEFRSSGGDLPLETEIPLLFASIVGFCAVVLASANVVGGFVVTDRMLEMFKKREPPRRRDE